VTVSEKRTREAVEWFVRNESGGDWDSLESWAEWCTDRSNRAEYVCLLQLAADIRNLPPPAEANRRELQKDVTAGERGFVSTQVQ
jgi:ferric-dicitrate binding protein FerR (iron transport regulator)